MARKKAKYKKFIINLAQKDAAMLACYAKSANITRPEAIRRIVRDELNNQFPNFSDDADTNQLNLFSVDRQTNLLEHIQEIESQQQ